MGSNWLVSTPSNVKFSLQRTEIKLPAGRDRAEPGDLRGEEGLRLDFEDREKRRELEMKEAD